MPDEISGDVRKRQEPRVCVMMPVYNGEATLPRAVGSLKLQTYENWYCIIVNDGSTDGTTEFLRTLRDDPRFEIITFPENRGRPYARQEALERARGKYLAFLDSDDFYHPEKLARQTRILEQCDEVDLVSCGNASFDHNLRMRTVRGCGDNKVRTYYEGSPPSSALRTSMIRMQYAKLHTFDTRLKHAQDVDFLCKYLDGRKYIVIDDVLYYYSEFASVTTRKILRTYRYGIVGAWASVCRGNVRSLERISHIALKAMSTALLAPFVSNEFFLSRRGKVPRHQECAEFEAVIARMNLIQSCDANTVGHS